jgi:hypothetical protein
VHVTRKLAREKAGLATGIAVALILSAAAAALALSVVLPPGGTVVVPATTIAKEPDLGGTVVREVTRLFTIKKNNVVVCSGQLHHFVIRSTRTQRLDFYYEILFTSGPGAINRIATTKFAGTDARVAYRSDSTGGGMPPRHATRSGAPGSLITFDLTDPTLSCAQRKQSGVIVIRTSAKSGPRAGGSTRLITTAGASVSVSTFMP